MAYGFRGVQGATCPAPGDRRAPGVKCMSLWVQKFGGTSVGTPDRIKVVAERIASHGAQGRQLVVVVSAMGDSTDDLLDLARKVSSRPSEREMDMLLATGEQVSIALLAMALEDIGVPAISLTGPQAGIRTDMVYGKGRIQDIDTKRMKKALADGQVVIVAGFQGINAEQDITTLGRGGSDLTAVALAAALKAEICEIYTDVDGVYTADPRIVPEARRMDTISYDECLELASLGARVLQSRSVEFAKKYNVPLRVLSSFKEGKGTVVMAAKKVMESIVVRGAALDLSEAKLTVTDVPDEPGVAARLFAEMSKANINVDMIVQNTSEAGKTDISFTIPRNDVEKAIKALQPVTAEIGIGGIAQPRNIAKLSIVGIGMRSHTGVAAKMFSILGELRINIDMISTSEIKLSVVIDEARAEDALKAVHTAFGLGKGSEED